MAISHIGSTAWDSGVGGTNTTDQTIPSTATTGRLIVLTVYYATAGVTINWPTGFTQQVTRSTPGTYAIATKIAVPGDASSTVTISTSASFNTFMGQWSIYDGVDTTTPVATSTSNNGGTCSTTTLTVLAVTTEVANSFVYAVAVVPSAVTFTSGTMTERVDAQHGTVSYSRSAADANVAAAGSSGSFTFTSSASTASWSTLAISIRPAVATTTLTQTTFRGRNDDGSETTATWKATAGTDWTQAVDTNFRVRFNINATTAAPTQNTAFILRYSLNGGAYTAVSASSSVVRASASANLADGAATTEQLAGAGTFNAGTFDEVDGSATGFTAATASGQDTEVEYSVQIRSADVANGDTINLRIYDNAGAVLNGGYTDTPIITVSEAAPTSFIWPTETPYRILSRR